MTAKHKPVSVGIAALLLVLAWQALVVHFNYHGNWSALFYIGDRWPLPPALEADGVRIFHNDPGYDGVFYHLVAHDPWLTRGFSRFADNPSLRWRRILIPGLAHTFAVGKDSRIHGAYIAVNLSFVFLGAWWLSRFCMLQGLSALFGFGFLAIPSVLVSMDRLTIDTALGALTIGFIVYALEGKRAKSLVILALCPLARETGLCLTAGQALLDFIKSGWKKAVWTAATGLPFLLWAGFIFYSTPADGTPWLSWPFAGIIRRTLHPLVYQITGRWVAVAAVLDYLALLGIWVALFFAGLLALKQRLALPESCAYFFGFAALWLGKADIWSGAYEFGRTMSPLLILLGLISIRDRNPCYLLPLACVLPRIFLQLEPQLRAMVKP